MAEKDKTTLLIAIVAIVALVAVFGIANVTGFADQMANYSMKVTLQMFAESVFLLFRVHLLTPSVNIEVNRRTRFT